MSDNPERHSGIFRRVNQTPLINECLWGGKHEKPIKETDLKGDQMVAQYSSKIVAITLFILGLSILDTVLTLSLIGNGARELNPMITLYFKKSPIMFVCLKYFLICGSVLLIFYNKDDSLFKTKAKAKTLVLVVLVPLILVVLWQLQFIFRAY